MPSFFKSGTASPPRSTPTWQRNPARFIEHLMRHKAQARDVEEQLNAFRGRCSVIASHVDSLDTAAQQRGLSSQADFFALRSRKREQEICRSLPANL